MAKKRKARTGAASSARKHIPKDLKDEVIRRCGRRCCMCFGLNKDLDQKDGQIAHLDRNRANIDIDNLAYLCLECHKVYDRTSNRTQGYTAKEISGYRLKLYLARREDSFEWTITVRAHSSQYGAVHKAIIEAQTILRKAGPEVSISEAPVN